jgi:alpha-tubulin suppressor-like RCC1 family protein
MALVLALGACADAPGVTAPATPMAPSGPSRLLVVAPGPFAQVSAGINHACAVSTTGALTCWGSNAQGQVTVPDAARSGIAQVSAGQWHTCAVSTAGALTCWGNDEYNQTTVPPDARSGIAQVTTGFAHTCAVSSGGAVTCWGYNRNGETNVPADARTGSARVATKASHTCAVSTAGALTCWGQNIHGEATVPEAARSGISQVATGGAHTCAVSSGGALTCWGFDFSGQVTVPDAARSGISQVAAGASQTCALSTAGAVTCWGYSGDGVTTVPAAAQSNVVQISAAWANTCALKTDGVVTCWGTDRNGVNTGPQVRVLPTATFTVPATVLVGQPVTLALTNAQVPGYTSTFTYAFDCGAGTYASSATASLSCPTTAAGVLTVRGQVIDQDGDRATYTARVTVLSAAQATGTLRELVLATTLTPDIRRALTAKLDDALKALAAGKTKPACSALADFASQVRAQRGRAIQEATADAWLVDVAAIQKAAGC